MPTPGETLFKIACPWLPLVKAADGAVPHITALWDRMRNPRRGDVVVDLLTLAAGQYEPARLGFYSSHSGRSWVITPYDEPDSDNLVEDADFVAIPGLGKDWPQPA